jgi:SAM domain (Sterile alpha motif)
MDNSASQEGVIDRRLLRCMGPELTQSGHHDPLDRRFPWKTEWSDVLMDIEGWPRSLGLERYEAASRENEIDDTILPRLTAEDLKELGVGPVGHRRKLLDAIADLRERTATRSITHCTADCTESHPANSGGSWRTPLPHGYVL